MKKYIGKEIGIHGSEWDSWNDGYFSSPLVATPFLAKIHESFSLSRPDVIVDLGGGTGFLLSELAKDLPQTNIRLVNLDCSDAQLAVAQTRGIHCVHSSLGDFRRNYIDKETKRFLFLMRSVLHYFGHVGLKPLLRHLRAQAKEGEFFIHQTASFENEEEADCINLLYKKMRTIKWYPTIREFCQYLEDTGWSVSSVSPSPALAVTSEDLARRYLLKDHEIKGIRNDIMKRHGERMKVLRIGENGFCAYLHYRIYLCRAV